MSRIGQQSITLPSGVTVQTSGANLTVQGPKGKLSRQLVPLVSVAIKGQQLTVTRVDEAQQTRALHGLMRTLVANMVLGVAEGFSKELEIEGVGFRAQAQGRKLSLFLGFSHEIVYPVPEGITVETPKPTVIIVKGADKELVGAVAARIRMFYKPEPYKGKGIRYAGEKIRRKAGKSVVK